MCLIDALTAFRACELPGEPVSTVLVDAAVVKPVDDLRVRLSAVPVEGVDEVAFEQTGAYLAALEHVLADLPHAA